MPDRIYYLDTYVAGRLYSDADLAWDALRVGMPVEMRREPDNSHDHSAIALWVKAANIKYKLGYLPMKFNEPLAQLIDMGWSNAFGVTLSRLDPSAPYDRQIGITVRILRCPEPEKESPSKQLS